MAMVPSDLSHHGVVDNSPNGCTQARCDEARNPGPSWYFSRKELEENSPSRRDGIDFKKECNLRKLYCKFLQELGMTLKMPQVTIATAMVFCHRFYLRQSLAKNDRRIIATVCLFLAGKVEETPKTLRDVILVSYGMIHENDPKANQRIKQKEIYDKQKELILLGERVVLVTLGFDLNVHHAYRPLVEAIRRLSVDNKSPLAQVAWNFVNDGLRTSLCLQFKPHHIAAGAIRLAARFLKVKLPSDGDKSWYQDFDVTPRQLEEISNQLLEMYEQNRTTQAQSSQGSEAEGSPAGVCNQRSSVKSEGNSKEPSPHGYLQVSKRPNLQHSSSTSASGHHHDDGHLDKHISGHRILQNDNANHGGSKEKKKSGIKTDTGMDRLHHDKKFSPGHRYSKASHESHNPVEEHQPHRSYDNSDETRDDVGGNEASVVSTSRMDAMNKIDKDKVKAALEKRRKSKGGFATKVNLIDDDDLERELEQGVELAIEVEKIKHDKKHNLSDGSKHPPDLQNTDHVMENGHHAKQNVPTTAEDMGCLRDNKEQPPSPFDKQNDVPEHKSHQLDDTSKHQKGYDHPQLVGSPEQDGKYYKRPKLDR